MTTPAQQGGGQWWVLDITGPKGGANNYTVVQSPTRPKTGPAQQVAAGPFPSKQQAQNWITAQGAGAFPTPPNPLAFLSWIQEAGHYAGLLVATLTDVHLYISLGWLVLGFILLVTGIAMWVSSTKTAGQLKADAITAGVVAA